jgi:nitrate reductase gamma subunit
MSDLDLILWVAIPYAAIAVFVVGHVWRWRRDQFTWTTRSTQLLESRRLRVGAILFHVGLLSVIGGHVVGILLPESFTHAVGIPESVYHAVSVGAGTMSGTAMAVGFLILLLRRAQVPRVRRTTSRTDVAVYVALGIMLLTGLYATIGVNLLGGGYDYRLTVAPYFRSIFALDPRVHLIAGAPLIYQLHVLSGFALYALWPFSRLVHAWSVPIGYLRRAPIVYRRRRSPGHAPAAGVSSS